MQENIAKHTKQLKTYLIYSNNLQTQKQIQQTCNKSQ